MTATAAVGPTGKIAPLRAEYEAAIAATRAANAACDRAQPDHDEITDQLRALRAERKAAPDNGASVAQLRALDSRIAETERRVEVSAAELRRLARARDEAKAAEDESLKWLDAAIRRAADLPRGIGEVRAYLAVRQRELLDAEQVAASIRRTIDEHATLLTRLEAELAELEGSE